MEIHINYLAVLACGVASMFIGFLWYGPLFGRFWMSLMGFTEKNMNEAKAKGMGKTYAIAMAMSLLTAFILAHFVSVWNAASLQGAFEIAFWTWLGFYVTTAVNSVLWEGKSWKLYFLNISNQFVTLFVNALILVFWP